MRRTERATAVGRALGGILGEGRLCDAVVLGLSAVAFQAAALDLPLSRDGLFGESPSVSMADAEDGHASAALRRRGVSPVPPPPWCTVAPAPRLDFARPEPPAAIAEDLAREVRPEAVLAALHPLRAPPVRPS